MKSGEIPLQVIAIRGNDAKLDELIQGVISAFEATIVPLLTDELKASLMEGLMSCLRIDADMLSRADEEPPMQLGPATATFMFSILRSCNDSESTLRLVDSGFVEANTPDTVEDIDWDHEPSAAMTKLADFLNGKDQ